MTVAEALRKRWKKASEVPVANSTTTTLEVAAAAAAVVVGTHCAVNDADDDYVVDTLDAALQATTPAAHIPALPSRPASSRAAVDAVVAGVVVRENVRDDTTTKTWTVVDNTAMC